MAKGELFATVLRGFHKDQVNRYIAEVLRRFELEKEELKKRLQKEQQRNRELTKNIAQMREENNLLAKELLQANEKNLLLQQTEKKPAPKKEPSKAGSAVFSEETIRRLRTLAEQIKQKMDEAGRMESEAKEQSEQIISDAKKKREEILNFSAADIQYDEKMKALRQKEEEILQKARAQSQEILQKAKLHKEQMLAEAKSEKENQLNLLKQEIVRTKEDIGKAVLRIEEITKEMDGFASHFSSVENETYSEKTVQEIAEDLESISESLSSGV